MNFTATLETIGSWNGREAYAVRRWNRHVAPVLAELAALLAEEDNDFAERAHQEAWEAFCSPGGSTAAVRAANQWRRQ